MEKESFSIESFKNIQQLIVFIHNKAYALLVIEGFLISVFIGFARDLMFKSNDINIVGISIFVLGLGFIVIAIFQFYYVLFKIIKPNLAKNYKDDDHSLFYFEHISKMEKEKYLKKIKDVNNNELLEIINAQVFEISKIMTEKTKKMNTAIKILFSQIIVVIMFSISTKI